MHPSVRPTVSLGGNMTGGCGTSVAGSKPKRADARVSYLPGRRPSMPISTWRLLQPGGRRPPSHLPASAWSPKEDHLAAEADIVLLFLLKPKHASLLKGTCGGLSRSHDKGDTCGVGLAWSPVPHAFHHTNGIHLYGSRIRWDLFGWREESPLVPHFDPARSVFFSVPPNQLCQHPCPPPCTYSIPLFQSSNVALCALSPLTLWY